MAKNKKGQSVHGWLNLDKPAGLTSTEALEQVRRLFDAKKVGHAGTLDPFATGILPIAFGEATKTAANMMDKRKAYECVIRWGVATDTDDLEGGVVETSEKRPCRSDLKGALSSFIGTIQQTPPAYSAIKVNGERAYDLARKGKQEKLQPRPVTVHAIEIIDMLDQDHSRLSVSCGKGTYIRALARDLAQALGTVAHVAELRRTQVGSFLIADSIPLEKLSEMRHNGELKSCLKPVSTSLDDIPALAVTGPQVLRLRLGQAISLTRQHADRLSGCSAAYASFGAQVVATGEVRAGRFHPKRVFNLPMKGNDDVDYS